MNDLKQLRRNLRAQRHAISAREQRSHSHAMAKRLMRLKPFLHSQRIALYLSADGEMDPAPILDRARRMGKTCFLPVLRPRPQRSLWFCEYRPGDQLIPNHFGIKEPSVRKRPPVPPWGLDLIMLPLVGFDDRGNRLGMGGGFYDRTLAFLHRRKQWCSPCLIGIAHDCQKIATVPTQSWDIPLHGVVTEAAFYSFVQYGFRTTETKHNT
ncbi:MAG TPA: 5-formyltetrahydrofolate cyclo-ligase [Sedimenticola sp.]|nr:5-formyltetrahydrofolate cyclo-ligase [Sedimenticola sp.]